MRAAVLGAAVDVLAERGPEGLTVAEVAARAGVNPTSIYRRWGGAAGLVVDAEVARLERRLPMPDTGSLRGDLVAYARQVAASLDGQQGLMFLRAVVATVEDGEAGAGRRFLTRRGEQIQAMLDRAVARGEPQRHFPDVIDGILAPLYLRRLLGIPGVDEDYLQTLADRVITWNSFR